MPRTSAERQKKTPVTAIRAPSPKWVDEVKSAAAAASSSMNRYVIEAVEQRIARDQGEPATTN